MQTTAPADGRARSPFEMMRQSIEGLGHSARPGLSPQANPGTSRLLVPIAGRAASTTTLLAQSGTKRTGSNTRAQAIVVNYSPTLVIQGRSDVQEIERRLLDAIGRHGHELASIIDREYAKRLRTEL